MDGNCDRLGRLIAGEILDLSMEAVGSVLWGVWLMAASTPVERSVV